MGYFEKFIKGVEKTTAYIGKKAKDGIDITKVSRDFSKETKKLSALYEELGMVSYEIHIGDTSNIDHIKDLCNKIGQQIKILDKLQNDMNLIKYGSEEEEEIEDQQEVYISKDIPRPEAGQDGVLLLKFCPNCQVGNHPEAEQCISCGHMFKK